MNYPNIKLAKLKHKDIAKAFKYKNVNSFRCSSAHKRIMDGVEKILEINKMTNEEINKVAFLMSEEMKSLSFHTKPKRVKMANGCGWQMWDGSIVSDEVKRQIDEGCKNYKP